MSIMSRKRLISTGLICVLLSLSLGACGQEIIQDAPEAVELLDPAGVPLNYEEAAYRNLYNAKTYSAVVCPYAEEYSVDVWGNFAGYAALPGDIVKKNDTILRTNTESIEEQIKNKKESIEKMQSDHLEKINDLNEQLVDPKGTMEYYQEILAEWQKKKPAERLQDNTVNPEYTRWETENNRCEAIYRSALVKVQRLETQIEQATANYELDLKYQNLLLSRLHEDRNEKSLLSGMNGVVANVSIMNIGDGINSDVPKVAVADTTQKVLKAEFISKADIGRAQDVYALIDGVRYEVDYKVMDAEEYKRLKEENDKVYTTFYFKDAVPDIDFGSFASIVVVQKSLKNVLTIPQDAVSWANSQASVYVLKDGSSVSTSVKLGMKDGVYAEVLSGVEEGDKIITDKAMVHAEKTTKLTVGNISNTYTESGVLAYPTEEWILNPIKHGTTYFVSMNVVVNQQVSKGDVIAEIRVVPDEIALTRSETKLQRERERLEEYKKQNDLEKKYVQKTIAAKEETIKDLEKDIAEMKADFATKAIKAPYDGIVTNIRWWNFKEGDLLQQGAGIVCMAKQDSNFIKVEDKNGLLNFGNDVEISYEIANGKSVTATGKVVTLNQTTISKELYLNQSSGLALIRIPAENIGDMANSENKDGWWSPKRFKLKATTRSMKNVVLVPKKAVYTNGTATYVKLVREDGMVLYQSFVAGGSDSSYYWVAEGLTEGMEVCIE